MCTRPPTSKKIPNSNIEPQIPTSKFNVRCSNIELRSRSWDFNVRCPLPPPPRKPPTIFSISFFSFSFVFSTPNFEARLQSSNFNLRSWKFEVWVQLHGRAHPLDVDAGRAQIAPPALRIVWAYLRARCSRARACPQRSPGQKRERAQADGASREDQVHVFHTVAKVKEEVINHRVVIGDDVLLCAWGHFLSTEGRPRWSATKRQLKPTLLQFGTLKCEQ